MNELNTPSFSAVQPPASVPDPLPGQSCLGEMAFFFSGAVLSAASAGFYRMAARRRTFLAVLFFIFFGLIVSIITTIGFSRGMYSVTEEIVKSYERGSIPNITIRGGQAEVDGVMPLVLIDNPDSTVIIDTTGQVTELPAEQIESGFLLTRDTLHILNRNDHRIFPLSQLNEAFGDPIVLDKTAVLGLWNTMSALLSVFTVIGLFLWTSIIRLGYIALLALPVWGIASMIRPNTSFNPVFITGLFAAVPALYLVYLLQQVKISFLFMGTLVLFAIWLPLLYVVLNKWETPMDSAQTIQPWRVLIGLPALLFFAANTIFTIPNGALLSWILALVTLAALIISGFVGKNEPQVVGGL